MATFTRGQSTPTGKKEKKDKQRQTRAEQGLSQGPTDFSRAGDVGLSPRNPDYKLISSTEEAYNRQFGVMQPSRTSTGGQVVPMEQLTGYSPEKKELYDLAKLREEMGGPQIMGEPVEKTLTPTTGIEAFGKGPTPEQQIAFDNAAITAHFAGTATASQEKRYGEISGEASEEVAKELMEDIVLLPTGGFLGKGFFKGALKEVGEETGEQLLKKGVKEIGEEAAEETGKQITRTLERRALQQQQKSILSQLDNVALQLLSKEVGKEIGEKAARETGEEIAKKTGAKVVQIFYGGSKNVMANAAANKARKSFLKQLLTYGGVTLGAVGLIWSMVGTAITLRMTKNIGKNDQADGPQAMVIHMGDLEKAHSRALSAGDEITAGIYEDMMEELYDLGLKAYTIMLEHESDLEAFLGYGEDANRKGQIMTTINQQKMEKAFLERKNFEEAKARWKVKTNDRDTTV